MKKGKFNKGEIVIYQTSKKEIELRVRLEEETVWLAQKQMAILFEKGIPTINEHIKNIHKEKELDKNSTIRKFRIVQTEGGRQVERDIEFYNLDVIISVGYRVKSHCGTQFRIWATKTLKDHLIKGYAINEKRLICFILLLRTTILLMAISASRRFYLFIFWTKMIVFTGKTGRRKSTITPWLLCLF